MLVHGEVIWDDSNNKLEKRPDSVAVRLYQGSTFVQERTVTPDISGRWFYEFDKVPLMSGSGANAVKLQYSLKQETVDGYSWSAVIVSQEVTGDTTQVDTRITDVLKETTPEKPGSNETSPSGDQNSSSDSSNTDNSTKKNDSNASVNINNGRDVSGSSSGGSISSNSSGQTAGSNGGRSISSSDSGKVKTGDDTNLTPLIVLLGISLLLILLCCLYLLRRRRRQ